MKLVNKEAVVLSCPTKQKKKWDSVLKGSDSHFFFQTVFSFKLSIFCINKTLRVFFLILCHLHRLLEWRRILLVSLS